jgi:ubiquinone/menaquinone biosynthesis C-methylase UbiE
VTERRSRAFVDRSVPEAYERFLVRQLFEPWANELLARAGPLSGASVLDVAAGPGTVARLAATQVGQSGRVVACDISAAMLALIAADAGQTIECVECSAEDLPMADASFQLVLCQQGLQFFPDRLAAAREMRRVLRPGGAALLAVWARERPLGLFGPVSDTMRECGLAEPYPRAFDASSYTLDADSLSRLFDEAGFADVTLSTIELESVWADPDDALGTIYGTPFGPLVAGLAPVERERVRSVFCERLGVTPGEAVRVATTSHIVRAVKP